MSGRRYDSVRLVMSPKWKGDLVQKAAGDLAGVEIRGFSADLYASNRKLRVITGGPENDCDPAPPGPWPVDVLVVVFKINQVSLESISAIASWMSLAHWAQYEALILITPPGVRPRFTICDIKETHAGQGVFMSTPAAAHAPRVLRWVLDCATRAQTLCAHPSWPKRPRPLRIAFADGSWWGGKGVMGNQAVLSLPDVTVLTYCCYIGLRSGPEDVSGRFGGQNEECVDVLAMAVRLSDGGERLVSDTARDSVRAPPSIHKVLLVDITDSGLPGVDDPVMDTWDYCNQMGIHFAFVTDDPACVQGALKTAILEAATKWRR
jgi:hypothetical protein